jgi:hypothetical protein
LIVVRVYQIDFIFDRTRQERRAFLNFELDGGRPPKIHWLERGNHGAQIYVNFDRYISMNAAIRANLLQN